MSHFLQTINSGKYSLNTCCFQLQLSSHKVQYFSIDDEIEEEVDSEVEEKPTTKTAIKKAKKEAKNAMPAFSFEFDDGQVKCNTPFIAYYFFRTKTLPSNHLLA